MCFQNPLEMLLPELELHLACRRILASPPDISRRRTGTAEIHTNACLEAGLHAGHISAVEDTVAHSEEQFLEVGTTKVGAAAQLGKRVLVGTNGVEDNVLSSGNVEALSEVSVNAEEVASVGAGLLQGLRLKRGEQCLEPFEGRSVLADPDEFHTAKTLWRVGRGAHVPDVLENRGPGSDTDTGTDQHSDFVLEDILGGGTIRTVDAELGHLLTMAESDLVHAKGIQIVVELGLSLSSAESVRERAGEVTNLADVDRDIGIEGARGDGERMPLVTRNRGHVQEQPLTGLVLERRLAELDFNSICKVVLVNLSDFFYWILSAR